MEIFKHKESYPIFSELLIHSINYILHKLKLLKD